MLTFKSFRGINNVLPIHRVQRGELAIAKNVDVGMSGEIRRRQGYSLLAAGCHKNVWQGRGFLLATVEGNDLVAISGASRVTVGPSLGPGRVWYVNLPDGRTAYSNGLICGIASASGGTRWGVPTPAGVGAHTQVAGNMLPGKYRYLLTYVRDSDGLEGAPTYSPELTLSGGFVLVGLPELAGHSINVYLTSANGQQAFLAGNTTGSAFAFSGNNNTLTVACRTEFLTSAVPGKHLAFWRGRTLIADGRVLRASLPGRWEHFDPRRDVKQFSGNITAVAPVDGGIFVGTETELAFLAGTEFDKLVYSAKLEAPVVQGSAVEVPGKYIGVGENTASGTCMMCLAGRMLVAGLAGGDVLLMSQSRYETAAADVAATFRVLGGVPQYVAVLQ